MNSIDCSGERIYPSKVVCVGRNYAAHIEELNNAVPDQPVIFIKPNSAIAEEIHLRVDDEIHYEGEICFVVKNKKLSSVGFGLDLTKRKLQSQLKEKGLPWERAKAFDGSAVFSQFISIIDDIDTLHLELLINGNMMQKGGCGLMLFKPKQLLDEISSFLTLEDGDVIMTGTAAGVGVIENDAEFLGRIYALDQLLIETTWDVVPN